MIRHTGLGLTTVLMLLGCSVHPEDFARQPHLTPVGSGLIKEPVPASAWPSHDSRQLKGGSSTWRDTAADLFRDARAMRAGDVITVKISIKDKATIDNTSSRSRESNMGLSQSMKYGLKTDHYAAAGDGSVNGSSDAKSSATGKGGVARSESIELQVAAVVTDVLANGNLLIRGSQEVRVNYDLHELTVAGVVRPRDVSTDNVISYERIAEARISYGGRGRISEVQQPGWGQQAIDALSPF